MKITNLRLNNFMSYRGAVQIDLANASICAIIGENGAGKSTLLEAITYCLFGQTRANSEDELGYAYDVEKKQWGVNVFGVGMNFELDGHIYQLERLRHPNKGELHLIHIQEGGFETVSTGLRETQAYLTRLLGMDYNSFMASVLLEQSEYDAFMKMSPSEAKEVLMKIIGLDQFQEKYDQAAEMAREAVAELKSAETTLARKKEELETMPDVDKHLASLDFTKAQTLQNLNVKKKQCEEAETGLNNMKASLTKYEESIQAIARIEKEVRPMRQMVRQKENKIDRLIQESGISIDVARGQTLETWRDTDAKLTQEAERLASAIRALDHEITKSETQLEHYRNDITELKANPQACLLNKAECNNVLSGQCTTKINELIEKGIALKAIVDSAKKDRDDSYATHEKLQAKINETRSAYEIKMDYEDLQQWQKTLGQGEENLARVQAWLDDNRDLAIDDAKALEYEIKGYKSGIEKLNNDILELEKEIGRAEERRGQKRALISDIAEMERQLPKLKDDAFIYETLKKAFSKEGIPALMIETVVPQLEAYANDLLGKLSDGRISLEFRLQKKLKTGGYSDSFEIYVTDEKGTRSVRMYSGGEKYRIVFSIHSAFSRYLTSRSGTKLKFLCIDEPAGLDDQGIERLVETLGLLREHYEQIFVITHLKNLVDYFPQTLLVEKTPAGSAVRSQGIEPYVSRPKRTGQKAVGAYDL